MKFDERQIWEQASGDGNRNYSGVCLRWGVILNGPGVFGSWSKHKDSTYKIEMARPRKKTDLWRFCEEMSEGDIVVLKSGQKIGLAVGIVSGEYEWRSDFGDVDGWDLQHVRRVKWLHTQQKNFDGRTFKFGDTTQKLISQTVYDWIISLNLDFSAGNSLPALPALKPTDTNIREVSDFLFDRGVADDSINRLSANLGKLRRIAKWYSRMEDKDQKKVSEAETISYLVIPFLTQLGWTPQRMAIEWNRVDVALFSSMPRSSQNLATVVEVKKLGNSCLTARSQAETYALKHNCSRLIVTDGIRYGMFTREESGFVLTAYLNITRLCNKYPIYNCGGAQDAIFSMLPESNGA